MTIRPRKFARVLLRCGRRVRCACQRGQTTIEGDEYPWRTLASPLLRLLLQEIEDLDHLPRVDAIRSARPLVEPVPLDHVGDEQRVRQFLSPIDILDRDVGPTLGAVTEGGRLGAR